MSDAIRKAAQDVIDRWNSPKWAHDSVHTGVLINALKDALAAPAQAAPHARDAVAWTPDTGYVFADAKNAQAAPDDAKQRLLEIMRRNGLATGHGDTLKQVIDTLEVELTDVLSAARQNAARYRWLRDVSGTEFMEELSDTFFGEWDAVIDAAMQQEQSNGAL